MVKCRGKLKVNDMSRSKKSRSLKRVTGGNKKTGSKERMKLENKQRKAKKKEENPRKVVRQRSVYQQHLDSNSSVKTQHAGKKAETKSAPVKESKLKILAPANESIEEEPVIALDTAPQESTESSLWDQLEAPQNNDIF